TINVYFKFLHPLLTDISLSRAEEMLAGAVIPFALLAGYEIWARSRKEVTHDYTHYKEEQLRIANQTDEETGEESSEAQNRYGLQVLARTMAITSMIFIALALFADY